MAGLHPGLLSRRASGTRASCMFATCAFREIVPRRTRRPEATGDVPGFKGDCSPPARAPALTQKGRPDLTERCWAGPVFLPRGCHDYNVETLAGNSAGTGSRAASRRPSGTRPFSQAYPGFRRALPLRDRLRLRLHPGLLSRRASGTRAFCTFATCAFREIVPRRTRRPEAAGEVPGFKGDCSPPARAPALPQRGAPT